MQLVSRQIGRPILEMAKEPCAGKVPVPMRRTYRNVKRLGCFADVEAGKVMEFHYVCLDRMLLCQMVKEIIDDEDLIRGVIRLDGRLMKVDAATAPSMPDAPAASRLSRQESAASLRRLLPESVLYSPTIGRSPLAADKLRGPALSSGLWDDQARRPTS